MGIMQAQLDPVQYESVCIGYTYSFRFSVEHATWRGTSFYIAVRRFSNALQYSTVAL